MTIVWLSSVPVHKLHLDFVARQHRAAFGGNTMLPFAATSKETVIMEMPGKILHASALALVLGVAAVGTGCATMDEQTTNSEQPVQDTWITTKVTTAFTTMDGVDNTDIGVETSNGVVTLTGRVDSQDQLDALVTAAKNVEGVRAVHTDLVQVAAN